MNFKALINFFAPGGWAPFYPLMCPATATLTALRVTGLLNEENFDDPLFPIEERLCP